MRAHADGVSVIENDYNVSLPYTGYALRYEECQRSLPQAVDCLAQSSVRGKVQGA